MLGGQTGGRWNDWPKSQKPLAPTSSTPALDGMRLAFRTIATMVPRGGFRFVTKKLMGEVSVPLITTNRFNNPADCEAALSEGCADMISMARPFLADPHLVKKARLSRPEDINTCIGCNQACLDHVFKQKVASCLVNPRACHEEIYGMLPRPDADQTSQARGGSLGSTLSGKRIAVLGGGPAGMSAAVERARHGADVVLFEAKDALGGQFCLPEAFRAKRSSTKRFAILPPKWNTSALRFGFRTAKFGCAGRL